MTAHTPAPLNLGGSQGHARALIRERQLRERFFPELGEPAWWMLLDLAENQGRKVSVTSLYLASFAPPTTALRYVGILEDLGFISREADPADHRRFWLSLTDAAWSALGDYFAAMHTPTPHRGNPGDAGDGVRGFHHIAGVVE
jgi:DNA-binding MarR family transcriptional regulator